MRSMAIKPPPVETPNSSAEMEFSPKIPRVKSAGNHAVGVVAPLYGVVAFFFPKRSKIANPVFFQVFQYKYRALWLITESAVFFEENIITDP